MNDGKHEHKYVYGGVRYRVGGQRPGTSNRDIEYWEWFFCEKCLEERTKPIPYSHAHSTFDGIKYDAKPGYPQ